MYGRIVLGVEGHHFEEPLEAAKEKAGARTDADIPADRLKELCAHFKAVVKAETGKAFPQNPTAQLRGAVEAVFRSWNGARAMAYRVRERIEHTTSAPRSTCRRWCSATVTTTRAPASASPATRPRARTSRTATSSSTRRAKTWWPASATPKTSTT